LTIRRGQLALFLAGLVLYGSALGWGLPETEPRERPDSWATDELAPAGLLEEIANTLYFRSGVYNPKYPFFGYVIQGAPTLPYYVAAAGLDTKQARTLAVARPIGYLARATTLLMAAAVPLLAWQTAAVLGGASAGWIAGLFALLFPTLFYYGRTSNVDAPALFLSAMAMWAFARILRDGLTPATSRWLAVSAALAISTKDTAFGAIVPAGIVVVLLEWRRNRALVLRTALLSAAVYLVASGLLLNPDRFWKHIHFIRHGSDRHHGFHYGSAAPYAEVLAQTGGFLVEHLGWLLFATAAAGALLWARRQPRQLLWLVPAAGVIVLTILPVRFVVYRFPMVTSYLLLFPAAIALSRLFEFRRWAAAALLLLLCASQAVKAIDMTWLMWNDSRYEAGAWLARNARPGDRIGYYGSEPNKLPFTDRAIGLVQGPTRFPLTDGPEFLIIVPYQSYETTHEYDLPETSYQALRSGRAGYRQMLGIRGEALLGRRPPLAVSPQVKIFVREDRLATLHDRSPKITFSE
jgi:4-amino-4-deoxy-L-arabinose transferase-like glycosyltransferase